MRKIHLLLLLMVASVSVSAQKNNYIHFGVCMDYTLLNDKTIGDIPLNGMVFGLALGFDHASLRHVWGVDIRGGYGFMNTYNFPDAVGRIADNYYGSLGGYYMHSVTPVYKKFRLFLGGDMNFQMYANQMLSFSNSEANYFAHLGIGPKAQFSYPFKIGKKTWSILGSLTVDVAALVIRPGYSLPFENDKITNVRMASFGSYGNFATRIGFFHSTKKQNAMEISYRWQYNYYTYENAVRHSLHSLAYILYFNL
ncbi:MAG: hypothetical protein PHD21_05440 [Flavobacteriales bacterium]|nr:hypothetical protein [Flavobacteriales bacterium]